MDCTTLIYTESIYDDDADVITQTEGCHSTFIGRDL